MPGGQVQEKEMKSEKERAESISLVSGLLLLNVLLLRDGARLHRDTD